jgi:hypothetical protein
VHARAFVREVQCRLARAGLHVQQPEHGVEQVVVAGRLLGAALQAVGVQAPRRGEAAGQPQHHRHLGLHARRDRVGHAVQVQPLLAERFAMVRDIQDGTVHAVGERVQPADEARQHVVGVQQRVVVGVDDGLVAAAIQPVVDAGGLEAVKLRGRAAVVGRAAVAELVQDDEVHAALLRQTVQQAPQQHLVQALAVAAQRRRRGVRHQGLQEPRAHGLAAGLVVAPAHRHAGARQHVQQVLAAADASLVVAAPSHGCEHARQGGLGVGAAARDLREVDHGQLGQLGRGLTRVAVQTPVGGPRRFTHHQDQQGRAFTRSERRAGLRVAPHRQPLAGFAAHLGAREARAGEHHVGRRDQMAQLRMMAHQHGHRLRDRQHRRHPHEQGRSQQQQPTREHLQERAALQRQAPQHPRRQCRAEQQRGQQAPVDKLARLGHMGVQHDAQHALVDEHAVAADEVGSRRGDQEQQRHHRLEGPAPGQQAEQQQVQRHQRHGQRRRQRPGTGEVAAMGLQRRAQERRIGQRQPQQTAAQQDQIGVDAAAREPSWGGIHREPRSSALRPGFAAMAAWTSMMRTTPHPPMPSADTR